MQRYFLRLSYRGAPFNGWQRQPSDPSVQQTIEEALSIVVRRPVAIVGAGRTDTGVNARTMYAHLDFTEPLGDDEIMRILRGANRLAGKDIALHELIPVVPDAHARFSAESRTYRYFTHTGKSPFIYPLSWEAPKALDYELMNHAAAILTETTDFTSFAKLHTDVKTNICRVSEARWIEEEDGRHTFIIKADRFLRNMVRAVVGTLVDVGRHKITPEEFAAIIERKDRCAAGISMPGHALFLWEVEYPDIIFLH